MFGLGTTELILILVLVLIVFGAGKLPEIGNSLGKGIRSFKKGFDEPDEIDVTPKNENEEGGEKGAEKDEEKKKD